MEGEKAAPVQLSLAIILVKTDKFSQCWAPNCSDKLRFELRSRQQIQVLFGFCPFCCRFLQGKVSLTAGELDFQCLSPKFNVKTL